MNTNHNPFCDGMARRDFLRVGAAGALGLNFSLARLLQTEAMADRKSVV